MAARVDVLSWLAYLDVIRQLRKIRRIQQRRRHNAEDSACPLHGSNPGRLRRQLLLPQLHLVRQIGQRRIERSAVAEEAAVRLGGKDQDDQVLALLGQAHRPRLIDPLPQRLHRHGGAGFSRLAGEVVLPPLAQHKVRFALLAQVERLGDLLDQAADALLDQHPSALLRDGLDDLIVDLPQVQALDLGAKVGVRRKLEAQSLPEQILQGPLEAAGRRRLKIQARDTAT